MRRWVQTIFLRCDRESSDPYDELMLCGFCRSSLYLRQVPWEHQVFDVNKTHGTTTPILIFSISDQNLKSHTHTHKNSTCGFFNKILSKITEKKTFTRRVAKSFFNQQVSKMWKCIVASAVGLIWNTKHHYNFSQEHRNCWR